MQKVSSRMSLGVSLLVTILLLLVFWLLVVRDYRPFSAGGLILSLGLLTFLFSRAWMNRRDKEWLQEIEEEFKFYKSFAWSLLAATALVIVGFHLLVLHFLFPESNAVSKEILFASIFALYFSTIAIGFGIHSLYSKSAPITSVYTLIRFITRDLKTNKGHKGPVVIVYPAPNIGCYRTYVDNQQDIPTSSEYSAFELELNAAISSSSIKFQLYCFPDDLVEKLFKCYVPSALKEQSNGVSFDVTITTERCVSCARSLINNVKSPVNLKSEVREIIPERFPSHVVVIENISYIILSYGLPFYDTSDQTFKPVESKRATLLAYRREDAVLADMIRNHLEMIWDKEPSRVKSTVQQTPVEATNMETSAQEDAK